MTYDWHQHTGDSAQYMFHEWLNYNDEGAIAAAAEDWRALYVEVENQMGLVSQHVAELRPTWTGASAEQSYAKIQEIQAAADQLVQAGPTMEYKLRGAADVIGWAKREMPPIDEQSALNPGDWFDGEPWVKQADVLVQLSQQLEAIATTLPQPGTYTPSGYSPEATTITDIGGVPGYGGAPDMRGAGGGAPSGGGSGPGAPAYDGFTTPTGADAPGDPGYPGPGAPAYDGFTTPTGADAPGDPGYPGPGDPGYPGPGDPGYPGPGDPGYPGPGPGDPGYPGGPGPGDPGYPGGPAGGPGGWPGGGGAGGGLPGGAGGFPGGIGGGVLAGAGALGAGALGAKLLGGARAGAGAGAGGAGGLLGSAGQAVGAGPAGAGGAASGAAARGAGMTGAPMMPMGGGAGGGDDKKRRRASWLREDAAVWGGDDAVPGVLDGRTGD